MSNENDEAVEPEEKPQRITRNMSEAEVKHAAVLLLNESGMGPAAIGKATGYHEKHVARLLPKLRKESLLHPRKLKLASKVVDRVMSGFVGEMQDVPQLDGSVKRELVTDHRVKTSDAVRAAELVYSRAEPVKLDGQVATNQTFIQVNQQFFLPDK